MQQTLLADGCCREHVELPCIVLCLLDALVLGLVFVSCFVHVSDTQYIEQ